MAKSPTYVYRIDSKRILVRCQDQEHEEQLKLMGFNYKIIPPADLQISYVSDNELALLLSRLQEMGVCFLNEPGGWPPAEIFAELRSKDLVCGRIKTISWQGPGEIIYGEL